MDILPSFLRKKIAKGPLVLARIAAKASSDKVFKTVAAAFSDGGDVIQRGCKASQLLVAVAAFVGVPFVHFDAVFSDVVVVDIGGGNFRFWFRRRPFSAEFPARLNFIGDQHPIQRPVSIWFAFFAYRSDDLQSAEISRTLPSEIVFSTAVE